uniref:Uncharacterized protein n=1 Tax=Arundo donax TaxID=35708 RepID=A0A0A9FEI2_ARUDO
MAWHSGGVSSTCVLEVLGSNQPQVLGSNQPPCKKSNGKTT